MNRIQTFLLLLFTALFCFLVAAQGVYVKDICQLTYDISARTSPRTDDQGHECALVRVNIPSVKNLKFQEGIVGDVEYQPGEYSIYIPAGSHAIPFTFDGKKGRIDFDEYNISVSEKNTYRVTLGLESKRKNITNGGLLQLTTEPSEQYILIDGVMAGVSPLNINLTEGKHIIAFPNTNGYSLPDQEITIHKNTQTQKHFKLKTTKSYWSNLDEIENFNDYYNSLDISCAWEGGPMKYHHIINHSGQHGIKDYFGKILVPCEFDDVDFNDFGNESFAVAKRIANKLLWGVYKSGQGIVLPCAYSEIWHSYTGHNAMFVIDTNNKWGLIDNRDFSEIVPCNYTGGTFFNDDEYILIKGDGWKGLENRKYYWSDKSLTRIKGPFDGITNFDKGYAIVTIKQNGKSLFYKMDKLGTLVPISLNCDEDHRNRIRIMQRVNDFCFTEGLFLITTTGSNCGVANLSGDILLSCDDKSYNEREYYEMPSASPNCSGGWCILLKDSHSKKVPSEYLAINNLGKVFKSDCYLYNVGEYLCLERDGKKGLIDKNGHTVLPFDYKDVSTDILISDKNRNTSDYQYIIADKEEQITIFDKSCNELLSFDINDGNKVRCVKDGIILVEQDDYGYGYINMQGDVICDGFYSIAPYVAFYVNVAPDYELLIQNGLALEFIGGRCGFIDKQGETVVPLNYEIILPFKDGTCYAKQLDGKWIELDLKSISEQHYQKQKD